MVILAADIRPPGPGQCLARAGPIGIAARCCQGAAPAPGTRRRRTGSRGADQDGRQARPGPARLRISWHAFPSNERRDARGVWTSSPACTVLGPSPVFPAGPI
jgi:hypothetical protein